VLTRAHTIGTYRLAIEVGSERVARALLPRVETLNAQRIVPLLERILEDVSLEGFHVRLDKLAIDLGTLPLEGLEEAVLERLEPALRNALRAAVEQARAAPSSDASMERIDASWLRLLEFYLLNGALPFAAGPSPSFAIEATLLALLDRDPDEVRALLYRHRHRPDVLARVVAQLGDAVFARLLGALDPVNATLLLAYLLDLTTLHRAVRLVDLTEDAYRRALWFLVLVYVVADPGSQFNRKSLVFALLDGLAESEGVPLEDLLDALRVGLEATSLHRSLRSSLPAVLDEIFADLARQAHHAEANVDARYTAHARAWDAVEHWLALGRMPPWMKESDAVSLEALFLTLIDDDPARVDRLVRRHARSRPTLERLVHALRESSLAQLVRALEPENAERIVAYVARVRDVHRREQLARLGDDAFGRLTWMLSLSYVVVERGSEFNRRSFVRSLLGAIATSEGVELSALLATLEQGLAVYEGFGPIDGSLPAIVRDLLRDLERDDATRSSEWAYEQGATSGRPNDPVRDAVLALLLGDSNATAIFPEDVLVAALAAALLDPSKEPELCAFLARHAGDALVRARWSRLPPPILVALVAATGFAVAPRNHALLLETSNLVVAAWARVGAPGLREVDLFDLLLEVFARHPNETLSIERLVLELFRGLAEASRGQAGRPPHAGQAVLDELVRLADNAGNRSLVEALGRSRAELLTATLPDAAARAGRGARSDRSAVATPQPSSKSTRRPVRGRTAFGAASASSAEALPDGAIYVESAGLVLAAPFLLHLFRSLDVLTSDERGAPRLRDLEAASRAVHALQFLVDGRTDAPEPSLVLPKVLAGVPIAAPIARAVDLSASDRDQCERLLRSMIAHWKIISNTSIAGLRETFLCREGKLTRGDDRYVLRVQRKTVDVLVDQIPWSISVIMAPWMPLPMHVTW
jgi:hypothetical protein